MIVSESIQSVTCVHPQTGYFVSSAKSLQRFLTQQHCTGKGLLALKCCQPTQINILALKIVFVDLHDLSANREIFLLPRVR